MQEQLAEQLGVSRTPVRDALNRLAQEELVSLVPGGGYLVNALTDHDITEVYQVRASLETLAARLACGRHGRVELARLHALIEEMAATDADQVSTHFELNRRFHRAVIEPCQNRVLLSMIDQLWDYPINRRITQSYLKDPDNLTVMVTEHRQILDAVIAHDEARLVQLTTEHMSEGYGETLGA